MKNPGMVPPAQDLERKKNLVERIEKLKISERERVALILAWKGLKPATDITLGCEMPPIDPKEWDSILPETEVVFRDLGLQYVQTNREFLPWEDNQGNKTYPEWKEYLVAKKKEDLEAFRKIWDDTTDEVGDTSGVGRLLGFPKTAVDAYGKDESIEYSELPEEVRSQEYMTFATLRLSKSNWEEELETVKKWADEIKRTDPKLYDQLVLRYRMTALFDFIDGMMKEADARIDFYENTFSQNIEIPNFPTRPLVAKWTFGFGNGAVRAAQLSIHRKDKESVCLAEIAVSDRWDGSDADVNIVPHYFDIFHRFVHRDKMSDEEKKVKGIGSFTLKLVESALNSLSKYSPDGGQMEIGMLTNQPAVIHFAETNGYEITNEKQKYYYDMLMKEIKVHEADPVFTKQGILPHFRFVNLQIDTPRGPEYTIEEAVINVDMLKEYCETKKPNFEKYLHLLTASAEHIEKAPTPVTNPKYASLEIDVGEYTERKENMRSEQPHPFFMDFYLSKKLNPEVIKT